MSKNNKSNSHFEEFGILLTLTKATKYWKVTRDGDLKRVEDFESINGPILSFHDEDFRISLTKKLSTQKIKMQFLSDFAAKVRIIQPRGKSYVYGTPSMRIDDTPHDFYPGVSFLDKVLENNDVSLKEPRIVGFEFTEVGNIPDPQNILILFAIDGNGNISPPECTLNVDDKRMLLREFSKTYNIKGEKALLFTAEQIFECDLGQPYPKEDDMFGVSITNAKRIVLGILGSVLLGHLGYYGYLKQQELSFKKKNDQLINQVQEVKRQKEQFLLENGSAVAKAHSFNDKQFFNIAEIIANYQEKDIRLEYAAIGSDFKAKYVLTIETLDPKLNGKEQIPYEKFLSYMEREIKVNELPVGKLSVKAAEGGKYEVEYEVQTDSVDVNSIVNSK